MRDFLKSVYPYLPVPLQNAGISMYGHVYKWERFGAEFAPTLAAFASRDRWSVDRMRSYLDDTLRGVLRAAAAAPYYRAEWQKAGIEIGDLSTISVDTLHRLPLLAKDSLRRDPLAFVAEQRGGQRLLSYHSSGSTGTPIRAICTRAGQQRFAAAREARSYRWAGTSILRPRAMIGGQPIVSTAYARPPYFRYNAAERQVYFSAYHLSPATVRSYVAGVDRYRPESFTGYAFSQFLLARLMLEQGLRFQAPPKAAITSSEPLTTEMRRIIAEAWGCRAYEEYGSVENCGLATECEAGRLHVSPDFGIVEIVDEHGRPLPPGREGRVVCTGLLNDAQFLVRYEIGDTASWSGTPCACGRNHLPVIEGLSGRVEDVVVGPDGRELVRFHGIFINLPHVLAGQVIQEALDQFRVLVIAESGFGPAQEQEIQARFHQRLGPVRVHIDRVSELERTNRGKVRAVISRLPAADTRRSG
jgi:phenylacetate-CoA ligase